MTDRRNGGVRLSACGRDLYLSGVEAEALLDYLESRRQGSEAAASA
ncbi:hypothetical protein [Gordonia polyisoprenivorans]|nr:hypothetical protein [Gordonia polyisoprenivorans]